MRDMETNHQVDIAKEEEAIKEKIEENENILTGISDQLDKMKDLKTITARAEVSGEIQAL